MDIMNQQSSIRCVISSTEYNEMSELTFLPLHYVFVHLVMYIRTTSPIISNAVEIKSPHLNLAFCSPYTLHTYISVRRKSHKVMGRTKRSFSPSGFNPLPPRTLYITATRWRQNSISKQIHFASKETVSRFFSTPSMAKNKVK